MHIWTSDPINLVLFSFRSKIQNGHQSRHLEFNFKSRYRYSSGTKSDRDMLFSPLGSNNLVYVPVLKLEVCVFKMAAIAINKKWSLRENPSLLNYEPFSKLGMCIHIGVLSHFMLLPFSKKIQDGRHYIIYIGR